jgi:glyoxylase-like metal-dependent hydrolase (beta-lactamase superfamily II)
MMNTLTTGISFVDLVFQGRERVIATAVLHGSGGVALVDPGPSSTLVTLRRKLDAAGIRPADVTALLLTHIHLDHAGAAGTLARENPRLRVFVHEKGAPHLADPTKLVTSASRLYGKAMGLLWGDVLAVPTDSIVALRGGERIDAAGRALQAEYTPGHASHHVSYFNADSGIAFVGDVAGLKVTRDGPVLPPTPPPDFDYELWNSSLDQVVRWSADTLFLTHFGPSAPSGPHVGELRTALEWVVGLAKTSLEREDTDEGRESWFAGEVRRELTRRLGEDGVRAYESAARFDFNWRGLARYWRKRGA